jgi:salicylate hydroxylase
MRHSVNQMTPNVARLLINWGTDKYIGKDLVEFVEVYLRRQDGTPVGYTRTVPNVRENMGGTPWWVVHRMHLHSGLADCARDHGTEINIDARVVDIDWTSSKQVSVKTQSGKTWLFDLLVGADGLKSVVRKHILPDVQPRPPTTNCAYRAIVPSFQVAADPITKPLVEKLTMDIWMSPRGYIISYPISDGKDFNMVVSHHRPEPVWDVEDVDIADFRASYKDYDPRIKRVLDMVTHTRRWPLLVTGPLETWSSPQKNVVLMGDAAHSMVNHMAQGAATSMEDGAFLGIVLGRVVDGTLSLADAIGIYEKTRMPLAYNKQQISFLNGSVWMMEDGPAQEARDRAMEPELRGVQPLRSPNVYADPWTALTVFAYDAERDAEVAVEAWLRGEEPRDGSSGVTWREWERYVHVLPRAHPLESC